MKLEPRHHDEMCASGISDEVIASAGIYSAASQAIRDVLKWQPRNVSWGAGWVVPFRFNGVTKVTYSRVKLDHPRHDKAGDIIKYESPLRAPNRAYFPPGFWDAIASPDAPIIITEGEKKTLSATTHGHACVGLVGVWSFANKRPRRRTGRATGPRQLIADLNAIHWHGRRVYIVFDSDAAQNADIRKAERALAGILAGRGADVRIVRLPANGDAKVGLDDFLAAGGDLPELLRKADAEPQVDGDERLPAVMAKPFPFADKFITEFYTHSDGYSARRWRDELHTWTGTHYEPIADGDFAGRVLRWLDGQVDNAKPRFAREVVECIGARLLVPANIEQPVWLGRDGGPADPADWIPMQNGVLDLRAALAGAGDPLHRHTPLWFTANSLPYAYDPAAECPAWFTFLDDALNGDVDCINLLAEWFGLCLTPDTRYHAIMLLEGPRRSGKGTTLRMLRRVVGAHNCCEPRLLTLAEMFGLAGLIGKRVAMCPDAHLGRGDKAMSTLEILKAISGEDAIEIHRKHKPSVNVRLNTRFILACNELPKFADNANALESRLLVLPFHNSYEGREDRQLEDRLAPEVAGVFNWALYGLGRLRENGRFTVPEVSRQILDDFARLTSPLSAFIEDCCTVDTSATVERDELYKAWRDWCDENGHLAGSREVFGTRLRTLVPRLDTIRPRPDDTGRRPRTYVGIGLTTPTTWHPATGDGHA